MFTGVNAMAYAVLLASVSDDQVTAYREQQVLDVILTVVRVGGGRGYHQVPDHGSNLRLLKFLQIRRSVRSVALIRSATRMRRESGALSST